MQRYPAGIAAHDLSNHAPVVRFTRRAQPVDGFSGGLYG
jgi:hypothetical protein